MAKDASGPDDRDDDPRTEDAVRDDTEFAFGETRAADDERGGEPDRIPLDLSDRPREDAGEPGAESDRRGPEPSSTPVEPGEPSLENAIFVLLGAVMMILVILRLVSLFPVG